MNKGFAFDEISPQDLTFLDEYHLIISGTLIA
jgi:hypothetical protein